MKKPLKVPSSKTTSKFYDDLMDEKEKRGILGKSTRYNATRILNKESTKRYFVDVVKPYITEKDKVLDFGCGPGSFLSSVAPFCGEITGVDISKNFVNACKETINELNLKNAQVQQIIPNQLPFADNTFDVLYMVDVIHHLEDIPVTIKDAIRVVKPGGRVLVFEPNKLNPLMVLVHLADKNEWGLLKVGTPGVYKKILAPYINVDYFSFSGLVVGPESPIFDFISDFLNRKMVKPVLGWLNPKMFIAGVKK